MNKCERCGHEVDVRLTGENGKSEALCMDCYNRKIAEMTGDEIPSAVPKILFFTDCEGDPHTFHVDFMLIPPYRSLTAREDAEDGYLCNVLGQPDEDFLSIWNRFIAKLSKMLSHKYIPDGCWTGDSIVGRIAYNSNTGSCDVIVDGKRYVWSELGKELSKFEGFQFKLTCADPSEDLY